MPMSADEIIKLLEQNGFQFIRSNGSHRIYRHNGSGKTAVVPYHRGDLKPGTEKSILKQAGLKCSSSS